VLPSYVVKNMPRVEFAESWDRHLHPMQSVHYRAGGTYVLSQEAAQEAVAAGRGKIVASPGERRSAASAAPANGKDGD
jgi:hypothetical protein